MNDLNSVIIEGTVKDCPHGSDKHGPRCFVFFLDSVRYQKKGDEIVKKVSVFEIHAHGILSERCREACTVNRKMRVIGRIDDDSGLVFVIAENVEFKPK